MNKAEFKEIASVLKFQMVQGMDNCFSHGETGNDYYIIVKGVVSIQIPNPSIVDRTIKLRDYKRLQKWMDQEFSVKMEQAKQDMQESYIMDAKKKQEDQRFHRLKTKKMNFHEAVHQDSGSSEINVTVNKAQFSYKQ